MSPPRCSPGCFAGAALSRHHGEVIGPGDARLLRSEDLVQPSGSRSTCSERWDVGEPEVGDLDPEPLAALCDILARHTATPTACWFGVWDGHGWLHPGSGIVAVFTRTEAAEESDGAGIPPPAEQVVPVMGLTWEEPLPAMPLFELHAWCVATDVDLRSTYIAVTPALADELLSDGRLETWPVRLDDPLS
ncbi:MAG: hypothetical protein QOJ23_1096 [Actinomycetota bacterium]|jgi:hypothetical protein|nr:hypothetical protein [Actinomycetota bacterium]